MKKDHNYDHDYLVHILSQIADAQEMDVAWAALVRAMNSFGFDRFLYGFTRSNTSHGVGERNDLLLLSNLPEEFLNTYIGSGLYLDSAMTTWALHNTGAMSWSMMHENRATLNEAQARVIAFNQQNGITAGYTVSFDHAITRNKSAIALIAPTGVEQREVDEKWEKNGKIIKSVCDVAHLKIASLTWPRRNKTLTARQREALEWVSDGKTTADIAVLMGLTVPTVEKHLRNARETLNAETTAQAIMKAAVQNQIFVIDSRPDPKK